MYITQDSDCIVVKYQKLKRLYKAYIYINDIYYY